MEQWLDNAMCNAPEQIRRQKLSSVRLLSVALIRYASFSHLAAVARETLNSKDEYSKMCRDFCK